MLLIAPLVGLIEGGDKNCVSNTMESIEKLSRSLIVGADNKAGATWMCTIMDSTCRGCTKGGSVTAYWGAIGGL